MVPNSPESKRRRCSIADDLSSTSVMFITCFTGTPVSNKNLRNTSI